MSRLRTTPAPPPIFHLLTITRKEPLGVERYWSLCGQSGITKRVFVSSLDKVTCPVCSKVHRKDKANESV
jgi:hypothetical protein